MPAPISTSGKPPKTPQTGSAPNNGNKSVHLDGVELFTPDELRSGGEPSTFIIPSTVNKDNDPAAVISKKQFPYSKLRPVAHYF
jgi:hypothetical protein